MCICMSVCIYTHTYTKSICAYKCIICTLVVYYGESSKGKPLKKFLYCRKWNFLALILKKFLYFRKRNHVLPRPNPQKTKTFHPKKILYNSGNGTF